MEPLKRYGDVGMNTFLVLSYTSFGLLFLAIRKTPIPDKILSLFRINRIIPKSVAALTATLFLYKLMYPVRLHYSIKLAPHVYDYMR